MLLHLKQADTTLFQSVDPPFALDTTWSNVSSEALNLRLQYWHLKWSLRNKLNLVKGILFFRGIYFFREIEHLYEIVKSLPDQYEFIVISLNRVVGIKEFFLNYQNRN